MKLILAGIFLAMTTLSAWAAPAPAFSDLSIKQVQAFFSNKTVLDRDRSGNAVMYFRPNGTLYLIAGGIPVIVKSKWSVALLQNQWAICLDSLTRRVPNSGGARITVGYCIDARQFVREADDLQPGDVLGLSKRTRPNFVLPGKKTSLAAIKGTQH